MGGANSQAHDVVLTSMRCNDVMCLLSFFLINQCQIITFFILKSDNIENSRIELKGIVLQVPSNQIKVTFIIILPFNFVHLSIFLFHIDIEEKCGWIIRGGQRVCWPPPSQMICGAGWELPSPPPPSSYACYER